MTKRPPFTDLPSLLAWLDTFSPADRVHIARILGDTRTTGTLARTADQIVYEMTRSASRAEVAETLGTSVRAVQSAVSNHIKHTKVQGRRGPARAAARASEEAPNA